VSGFELAASRRPDAVFAGVYDPDRRGNRGHDRQMLTESLSRFGAVGLYESGPLLVGTATPMSQSPPTRGSATNGSRSRCFIDGHIDNLAELAPGPTRGGAEAVLAELLSRDATGVLRRMRGAWSLLYWNEADERGFLARDQLNQRPLFVCESDSRLCFGTELPPVLALPTRRPAPDTLSIVHLVVTRPLRQNRTFYEGVRRLPGGELLHLERGGRPIERFWAPTYEEPLAGAPEELAERTRAELARAVTRSVGDARSVGVFISGGLDSSAVAAVAVRELRDRGVEIHAYTATFPTIDVLDESEFSAPLVRSLGIAGTAVEVYAGSSLGANLEHLEAFETPELSANGFFMRPLGRRASDDGVDVILSGEGGDEIFAAATYLIADALRSGRLRTAWRLVERYPEVANQPGMRTRLRLLRDKGIYPVLPSALQYAAERRRFFKEFPDKELPDYLRPELVTVLAEAFEPHLPRNLVGPYWWAGKAQNLTLDQVHMGPSEVTSEFARLGSYAERHPLLTLDLAEHVLRLPPEHGFDAVYSRPDLRRALVGLLPEEIRLRRHKRYFDSVRGLSILEDLSVIRELLEDRDARMNAFLRRDAVRALLDMKPRTWQELSIWGSRVQRIVVLECWLRFQDDRELPERLRSSGRLIADQLRFVPFPSPE
jgi:asparagine synthase (glutamine-hydrolysing)